METARKLYTLCHESKQELAVSNAVHQMPDIIGNINAHAENGQDFLDQFVGEAQEMIDTLKTHYLKGVTSKFRQRCITEQIDRMWEPFIIKIEKIKEEWLQCAAGEIEEIKDTGKAVDVYA